MKGTDNVQQRTIHQLAAWVNKRCSARSSLSLYTYYLPDSLLSVIPPIQQVLSLYYFKNNCGKDIFSSSQINVACVCTSWSVDDLFLFILLSIPHQQCYILFIVYSLLVLVLSFIVHASFQSYDTAEIKLQCCCNFYDVIIQYHVNGSISV